MSHPMDVDAIYHCKCGEWHYKRESGCPPCQRPKYVKVDEVSLFEALQCVAVRARWYETRRLDVPERTAQALVALADALGVDPSKVGKP